MGELILYAVPAFVLLLAVELWSFRLAADEDLVGYEARDTGTSLSMGAGNVAINAVWKLAYTFRGPGWSPGGSRGGTRG